MPAQDRRVLHCSSQQFSNKSIQLVTMISVVVLGILLLLQTAEVQKFANGQQLQYYYPPFFFGRYCICPNVSRPVCGEDGNDYPSRCHAACAHAVRSILTHQAPANGTIQSVRQENKIMLQRLDWAWWVTNFATFVLNKDQIVGCDNYFILY